MIGLYMERDVEKLKPCVNLVDSLGTIFSVLGSVGRHMEDFEQIDRFGKVLLKR